MEMERSPFLPLPEGMIIGQVEITEAQLTVEVISAQPFAYCPGCGSPSDHIHCQYQRTVHDVPCGGRRIVLRLGVRKFFCRVPTCPRKVFAERLADLVQPWARVSNRLLEELKALGLAASAEVNERLTPRLGMKVKAPTLLRYLRTIPPPVDTFVRVLGVDDFSIKRGDSYGTILVNLETHRPLDLLPDRTADAVFPWLKRHQEIDIVSRDRASAYADAANRALPHAIQVADRYHVLQNLREHLQRVLDRNRSCLPMIEDTPLKGASSASQRGNAETPSDLLPEETLLVFPESAKADQLLAPQEGECSVELDNTEMDLSCLTYTDRKKKINRDKRVSRYEEVMALHQTGIGQRALARQLGMSRKTVKLFVSSPVCPQRAPGTGLRPKGKSKLDPYRSYLRERWDAGTQNSSLLFGEIKERGYTGSASLLRMALSEWRTELPPKSRQGKPRKPRLRTQPGLRRLSSRSASFLLILPLAKRTAKEKQQIEHICQASSDLRTVYLLSQEFVTMLKERQVEALDSWLKQAKESQVTELVSFVNGIVRDVAAVRAAFSLPLLKKSLPLAQAGDYPA
jgi:transposase